MDEVDLLRRENERDRLGAGRIFRGSGATHGMAGNRKATLALSDADAALSILKTVVAEALHADDRKKIDSLIERCRNAIDRGSSELDSIRTALQKQVDFALMGVAHGMAGGCRAGKR